VRSKAAELAGGKNGLIGYLRPQAKANPSAFVACWASFALQMAGRSAQGWWSRFRSRGSHVLPRGVRIVIGSANRVVEKPIASRNHFFFWTKF
jgi:hypothetical protein